MRRRDLERAVAELATRQEGPVGRKQLLALGLTTGTLRTWRATGRLHERHRGVYTVGHAALTLRGTLRAALLALGEDAVVSHRTAAALWGLLPGPPARPDLTIPRRSGCRHPGIAVHRVRRLAPEEVTVVDSLRCTTVPRTLLDLAECVDPRALRCAVREAAVLRLLVVAEVDDVLARATGRRGCRPLRRALAAHRPVSARTASPAEDELLALCRDFGLPEPMVNVRLRVAGRVYQMDMYWPEARLAVEVDGRATHELVEAFEHDRRKDDDLRDDGIDIRRVTVRRMREQRREVGERLQRAHARGLARQQAPPA